MKTIKYYLPEAYECGIKLHPQKQMELLGCKVLKYEGVEIGNCIFMQVKNLPENLPPYIELSDWDFGCKEQKLVPISPKIIKKFEEALYKD